MKKLAIGVVAAVGGLLIFGSILEASKSPEQKAAEAADAREYAAQREAERKEEAAYSASKEIVEPARDMLELAYIERVKDQGASHISCREATLNKRFFVRCGVGYGNPDTANNGLWEAAAIKGKPVLYAMNGKALRALEKIGEP